MSKAGRDAIGLLIENFQEFLEWIFEPKSKTEIEELLEIDTMLQSKFDITVSEIIKKDLDYITSKMKMMDVKILDKLIVLLYNIKTKKEWILLKTFKLEKLPKVRIMELIQFAEKKSDKLSLERNNVKNSLDQQLKN